jgi:hypothetical protein
MLLIQRRRQYLEMNHLQPGVFRHFLTIDVELAALLAAQPRCAAQSKRFANCESAAMIPLLM